MSNAFPDSSNKTESAQPSSPLSYKGPVAGLKGLLTNKIAEGLANVVSTIDRVTDFSSKKSEGGTEKISIERIYPSPDQPRQVFDPKAMEELSQTMRELGQAQAITVRKTPQGFEIISGERRYRAAKLAGFVELDCVVKECSLREARLLALVENIQRQDLLPVEEAHYLRKVLDENADMSLEKLAKVLGSHKSTLSEKIQLTEVPEDLQGLLFAKGRHLTHRHWRVISRIPDESFLRETFVKAVENQLSVAELERSLEIAGIAKSSRRKSMGAPRAVGEATPKVTNFLKMDGKVLRFKAGSMDLGNLPRESKDVLAQELERALEFLRAP